MKRTIRFARPIRVDCDGTSIWMCTDRVFSHVSEIRVISVKDNTFLGGECSYVLLEVDHDAPWEIYTDKGFEEGISDLLAEEIGFYVEVGFTEQGMQDEGVASMEPIQSSSDFILHDWVRSNPE